MTFRVRFTEEALEDLERFHDFILERDRDFEPAQRALQAIRTGISMLEHSPFSCRKAGAGDAFLRELVVGFGSTGYVALFEIETSRTVTVLAVRHQREDDYR